MAIQLRKPLKFIYFYQIRIQMPILVKCIAFTTQCHIFRFFKNLDYTVTTNHINIKHPILLYLVTFICAQSQHLVWTWKVELMLAIGVMEMMDDSDHTLSCLWHLRANGWSVMEDGVEGLMIVDKFAPQKLAKNSIIPQFTKIANKTAQNGIPEIPKPNCSGHH